MSLAIAGYFPHLPPIPFIGAAWQPPTPTAPKPRRTRAPNGALSGRDWTGVHGKLLVHGVSARLDSLGRSRYVDFRCLICQRAGSIRIDNLVTRRNLDDGCVRCVRVRAGMRRRERDRAKRESAVAAAVEKLRATNAARRVAR